jgi:hypothetical protein
MFETIPMSDFSPSPEVLLDFVDDEVPFHLAHEEPEMKLLEDR